MRPASRGHGRTTRRRSGSIGEIELGYRRRAVWIGVADKPKRCFPCDGLMTSVGLVANPLSTSGANCTAYLIGEVGGNWHGGEQSGGGAAGVASWESACQ